MICKGGIIRLWAATIGVLLFTNVYSDEKEGSTPTFSFGVIADCQYCNAPPKGIRNYSLSEDKLQLCVVHFNTMDLDYVVHLGDFIDRTFENFDVLNPIYNQLKMPKYHVLGNHDYSVADEKKTNVPQKLTHE